MNFYYAHLAKSVSTNLNASLWFDLCLVEYAGSNLINGTLVKKRGDLSMNPSGIQQIHGSIYWQQWKKNVLSWFFQWREVKLAVIAHNFSVLLIHIPILPCWPFCRLYLSLREPEYRFFGLYFFDRKLQWERKTVPCNGLKWIDLTQQLVRLFLFSLEVFPPTYDWIKDQ